MSDEDRQRMVRAIRELGVSETSRRLATSAEATLRLALGARVHRGTEALALSRLGSLPAGA